MDTAVLFDQILFFVALPAIGVAAAWLYLRGRQARVRTLAATDLLDALDQLEALARRTKNRAQQIEQVSAEVAAASSHRRALIDQTNKLFAQVLGQSLRDRQWLAQNADSAAVVEFDSRREKHIVAAQKLEQYLQMLDVALSEAQAVTGV